MSIRPDDDALLDTLVATPDDAATFDSLLRAIAHGSTPGGVGAAPPIPLGTQLASGRLAILRKLGEGGMGVVYEGIDAQRRARVACKTLSRLDASNVYRLKNEFRALADVVHPNLVRLHELFADGPAWFFTMELIAGERFDRWVRPDGLDEQRLRAALPQLLAAIEAVHRAGKLHRDLKPSNVLVTAEGRVVVLDFGLAIDPDLGGVGQTVADQSVSGTPSYMAPEQANGLAATTASDFYALGVMLFEALTGRLPFEGRVHDVLADKGRREAPSAGTLAQNLPADLEALCAELLSREPAARPDAATIWARLKLPAADITHGGTHVRGTGDLVELLGREPELQELRKAFAGTEHGSPVVLFVTGESGMGKSALCQTFAHELRAQGRATVLAGRCYERENVPFKGFDALIDDLSRHLRRMPGEEAAALLPREAHALACIFPVLERIPVFAAAPKKQVADPQELKQRGFEAFGELLGRIRDRTPLVLIFDDVQWFDQDSVRFLRSLFLQPVPLLLICVHRSEGALHNSLLQSVHQSVRNNARLEARELQIGELSHPDLVRLASRMLHPTASPLTADGLADEAGGSPYFLMELARAASVLGGDNVSAPSLAEALSWHIQCLPPSAAMMLKLLAIAGQPIPADAVLDAVGHEDGSDSLDHLRAEQLIRVSFERDGLRSIECYHDKITEQLAATIDAPTAREHAARLASALETRADVKPELLARLLHLAGRPVEAAEHEVRAAERARTALAFDHAAQLYAQALEHGAFAVERRQALRVAHADALAYAGRSRAAADAYLLATQDAAIEDVAELERRAGEQYLTCGALIRGRELYDRALRHVGHRIPRSIAGAVAALAWSRARLRLRGLSFRPRAQHDAATVRELELLRGAVAGLVRTDQLRAADFSARYVLRALDSGHSVETARAMSWEMLIRCAMNAPQQHVEAAERLCTELCEQTGDQRAMSWLAFCTGCVFVLKGQPNSALPELDSFVAYNRNGSFHTAVQDRSWAEYYRALSFWSLGRVVEAGQLATRQLDEAIDRGDLTAAGALVQPVVFGLLALDRPAEAERYLERARTWLTADEIDLQHMMFLYTESAVSEYLGNSVEVWMARAVVWARYFSSWHGRTMFSSTMRALVAGFTTSAARATTGSAERRALYREAQRYLRGASDKVNGTMGYDLVPRDVLQACIDRDRVRAIANLRRRVPSADGPLATHLLQRRLGELIGDEEGAKLIAGADAFLREGGIVNPMRFTAAFTAGLSLDDEPANGE